MSGKEFKGEKCFICHSKLLGTSSKIPAQNRTTVEHFIPRWLLRESGLHQLGKARRYSFPNGVRIKGHPVVPCCQRCNDRLSFLEPQVQKLFNAKRFLDQREREIMFLWLLKVAYGSAFRESVSHMSTRRDIDFGRVISKKAFERMKRFHGRILKEYCIEGSIQALDLLPYSIIHAETSETELIFSKSPARNRVVVAWNGSAFRLALDGGTEEAQLLERGNPIMPAEEFSAFLGSEDIFPNRTVEYPELRRRKQKTVAIRARKLSEGDKILILRAEKISNESFKFFGHILEKEQIIGEENSVLIIVKRTFQDERTYLDEMEVHQPGLRLVTKTAVAVMNFADIIDSSERIRTPEEEMVTILFITHEALKINFCINSTLQLGPAYIP